MFGDNIGMCAVALSPSLDNKSEGFYKSIQILVIVHTCLVKAKKKENVYCTNFTLFNLFYKY